MRLVLSFLCACGVVGLLGFILLNDRVPRSDQRVFNRQLPAPLLERVAYSGPSEDELADEVQRIRAQREIEHLETDEKLPDQVREINIDRSGGAKGIGIYKCKTSSGVVYQQEPCQSGEQLELTNQSGAGGSVGMQHYVQAERKRQYQERLNEQQGPSVASIGNGKSSVDCRRARDQYAQSWVGAIVGDSYGKNTLKDRESQTGGCY
ncbi:hypothetical protein [Chitiniphilus eburneus]|uniref:hypothetical protein n=1 Tax=Chitiniphilus eburneus TaxID=2571148 RepID=UPI0035CFEC89